MTTVLRASLDMERRLADAARPYLAGGLRADEGDEVYGPFAQVAAEVGYTGDPRVPRSPFFITMHGYRQALASA